MFLRFKADEASQAIAGHRRMTRPEDNNERQQIHDHDGVPLPMLGRNNNNTVSRTPSTMSAICKRGGGGGAGAGGRSFGGGVFAEVERCSPKATIRPPARVSTSRNRSTSA